MQSIPDRLYDLAALLKHEYGKGDLIGVMQLEAQLNALITNLSADFHSANRPAFCASRELVAHGAATEPGDGDLGQGGLAQYG